MLIYIHGFNSSSQSGKARELAAWMATRGLGESFVCPDLPHRPAEAIRLLGDLIAASRQPVKLMGSSLGGFYAAWLAEKHGLRAVFVNPCVGCNTKLAAEIGQRLKNWHTGEEYEFTPQHVAELDALWIDRLSQPENALLLVETGDEVLDYREAVAFFAGSKQIVLEGGDHGFSQFTTYIPTILEF